MSELRKICRKDAAAQGLTRFFTGRPCKYGHLTERIVSSGACYACSLERLASWRACNSERSRQSTKAWWAANPKKNVAKVRNWQRNNPDKVAAQKARRRAQRIKACPPWISPDAFQDIYKECRRLSRESGQLYHVDHIIPLKGKEVCGLHVPWNLRIIPAVENLRKGTKVFDV